MVCLCETVEFTSDLILKILGRCWDLGPVVVQQDQGSNILSLFVKKETLDHAYISLNEFKQAVMSDVSVPFNVKFAVKDDRGPYGFGELEFDDQVMCRYLDSKFSNMKVELRFEMLAKGKELVIFNEFSGSKESTGSQKPLFWASVLKGNIH